MAQRRDGSKSAGAAADDLRGERIFVEDKNGRRPFMRGIMVHALMARGVGFDLAYKTADRVHSRLAGRTVVPRDELARMVGEELGEDSLVEHQPPLPDPYEIEIGAGKTALPFSKGVLAQSLLAASIDPTAAFETARDIESELRRRGDSRVSRGGLRKLAYQALLERFGERTADRYRIWRQHQEPRKPVIILLGGTTGVGKTSIALEVALRLGIRRVLSTDSIRQVMRIVLSRDLAPALHASSFDAHRALKLEGAPGTRVVDGFLQQATAVTVGVRAILDRAVEENTSVVIDGVSLVPGLLDLASYAESAQVIPLVVARLDEESFRGHFRSRGVDASRRGTKRYLENLDAILRIQEYMLEAADEHDVPIVDNLSVESSVLLVIRHVVETLRERSVTATPELPYAKRP